MRVKLTALALLCTLLAACGIKGPLYLPTPGQTSADADHNKPFQPPELSPRPPIE